MLPAVQDNIEGYHKLNCHLYDAVKKAMFKPKAFFKGFIFPLVEKCTAREAAVIGSILAKCSINVIHAGAALCKLCEMPYSIGTVYFVKIFLTKSYAFPQAVVDHLVDYFFKFTNESETNGKIEGERMPILWH